MYIINYYLLSKSLKKLFDFLRHFKNHSDYVSRGFLLWHSKLKGLAHLTVIIYNLFATVNLAILFFLLILKVFLLNEKEISIKEKLVAKINFWFTTIIHSFALLILCYYRNKVTCKFSKEPEKPNKSLFILIFIANSIVILLFQICYIILSYELLLSNYFLYTIITNLIVFLSYFTIQKYRFLYNHDPHLNCGYCWILLLYYSILIIIGVVLFVVALLFFHKPSYNTDISSVESIESNVGCSFVGDMYDNHDWWHVFSAFSLYCFNLAVLLFNEDLDLTKASSTSYRVLSQPNIPDSSEPQTMGISPQMPENSPGQKLIVCRRFTM